MESRTSGFSGVGDFPFKVVLQLAQALEFHLAKRRWHVRRRQRGGRGGRGGKGPRRSELKAGLLGGLGVTSNWNWLVNNVGLSSTLTFFTFTSAMSARKNPRQRSSLNRAPRQKKCHILAIDLSSRRGRAGPMELLREAPAATRIEASFIAESTFPSIVATRSSYGTSHLLTLLATPTTHALTSLC